MHRATVPRCFAGSIAIPSASGRPSSPQSQDAAPLEVLDEAMGQMLAWAFVHLKSPVGAHIGPFWEGSLSLGVDTIATTHAKDEDRTRVAFALYDFLKAAVAQLFPHPSCVRLHAAGACQGVHHFSPRSFDAYHTPDGEACVDALRGRLPVALHGALDACAQAVLSPTASHAPSST